MTDIAKTEKPLMEVMQELEKAVKAAKEKEAKMNTLNQQLTFASKEYSDAVEVVNELRTSLNERLGNIFPNQDNRIRQSS